MLTMSIKYLLAIFLLFSTESYIILFEDGNVLFVDHLHDGCHSHRVDGLLEKIFVPQDFWVAVALEIAPASTLVMIVGKLLGLTRGKMAMLASQRTIQYFVLPRIIFRWPWQSPIMPW